MKNKLSTKWIGVLLTALVSLPTAFAADTSAPLLRVDLHAARDFSSAERAKLEAAIDVIEIVVNSPEFQQRIRDFSWKGQRAFANNAGMSNEQILQAILAGKETFSQIADSVMDIEVTIYNAGFFGRNVVGYTNQGSKEVHVNRAFFKRFTPAQVAANLVHEWCHMLGFEHDYRATAQRPYSVPYAVGDLVIEVAKTLGVGQK